MIYLYGILKPEAGADLQALFKSVIGVTSDVEIAEMRGLLLVHGEHDGGEILPRRRTLLAHAKILELAMSAGTVLPMRFGLTCPSLAAFETLLGGSVDKVGDGLKRLSGRVEVGVRVVAPETPALEAAVTTEPNLVRRRNELSRMGHEGHFAKVEFGRALGDVVARRRSAAQTTLIAALKRACVDYVVKAPETDFQALRAEFLVDAERMEEFSKTLEHAAANLDFAGDEPCQARLVGPGPAFHFADFSLDTHHTAEVA